MSLEQGGAVVRSAASHLHGLDDGAAWLAGIARPTVPPGSKIEAAVVDWRWGCAEDPVAIAQEFALHSGRLRLLQVLMLYATNGGPRLARCGLADVAPFGCSGGPSHRVASPQLHFASSFRHRDTDQLAAVDHAHLDPWPRMDRLNERRCTIASGSSRRSHVCLRRLRRPALARGDSKRKCLRSGWFQCCIQPSRTPAERTQQGPNIATCPNVNCQNRCARQQHPGNTLTCRD
ncbi:hypothetical protein P154DRAFT_582531 [Amniculicola lignicola CBS 123094]|uniref:Uncharacterized protein n=1 Tax=Amniculicola lignicola CBS 123094 TaxID=1392246 RepID=A0A6A5VVA3_9PLEO|nr:hypothetical protein P154DRAFT_582531 [Amniculicola lignicola CBS 123094]